MAPNTSARAHRYPFPRTAWRTFTHRRVGDMQLTKKEIAETQIIVTTPEKWDVVTRKPTGEGELASVSLIISTKFGATPC